MDYSKIGEHIRLIDNRNTDLAIDKLVGLTVDKRFIPSVANIIGTDLSKYKVIRKNQFACSLMQVSRDGKMPVAMFAEEAAIMSPAYPMFEVKDDRKLLPEYLMMYLYRSEFDREAVFYAVGGVRGSLEWEDFCNITIPVPPIEEQRRMVNEYQTVERRIKNNEALIQKLEETAQTIYHHTFVEGIDENNLPEGWRMGCLGDVCEFAYGKMPDEKKIVESGYPVYCGYAVTKYYSEYSHDKPTIVIIARGDAGSGEVHISPDKFFLSNLGIAIIPKDYRYNNYLLFHLQSLDTYSLRTGTAQAQITINNLVSFGIIIPSILLCEEYNKKIEILRSTQKLIEKENQHLFTLQSLLTSKLA